MFKMTHIFTQTTGKSRVGGWSETWYVDGTEREATLASDSMSKRRAAMLSTRAVIVAQRIQEVGGRGKTTLANDVGILGSDADIPQMAVQCFVLGQGVTNKKTFQLRGIPDGLVGEGDFKPSLAWNSAFSSWSDYLNRNSIRFRAKNLALPQVQIISIADNGAFVLAGPLTFAAGARIDVSRCKSTDGKKRSGSYWVGPGPTATTGVFTDWPGGVVALKGKARVNAIIYPLVLRSSAEVVKIGTRKVGRPFDLYPGRRSSR
jgi:hypothetical protein